MESRLGFGIDCNNEYGDQFGKIADCRPAVIVALINPNEPGKAAPAINAAHVSVIRHFPAEKAMSNTEILTPTNNAARYWQLIKPIVALYPDSYFAYWRNEVGDDGSLSYHRDEMLAWIQVAEAEGFKVAVGNFSVGVPDFGRWASVLNPLMAKLHEVGSERALLNLHEYWFGDVMNNAEFLGLRHRKIWRENGYASRYGRVKIVIGETGLEKNPNTGEHGPYKAIGVSDEAYIGMHKWYDAELAQDASYVVGAANFQWSRDPKWQQYDIQGSVADGLCSHIKASGTQPPVVLPPPSPPPWVPPVVAGRYKTTTNVYLRPQPAGGADKPSFVVLPSGKELTVEGISGEWAEVKAYIHKNYITKIGD